MRRSFKRIVSLSALIVEVMINSHAQQFGWRGVGRTGIYNEAGLLKSWSEAGPKLH